MRRALALLAMLVTTSSNVAVLGCDRSEAAAHVRVGSSTPGSGHRHAEHHTDDEGAPSPSQDDAGGGSPPDVQDCGLAMACGAALGGSLAAAARELPVPLAELRPGATVAPASADLSQDPPPPRRLA